MLERFSRSAMLLGDEGIARLRSSVVAVFGVGGVGSYAVEALARSGVGTLVLVDDDTVQASNINRQIEALHSTLGQMKVVAMRDRVLDINPDAVVEIHAERYSAESAERLLRADYSYVIDAIDSVSAKIDLIVRAKALGLPIISCMGAGNKLDPSRFELADIYSTKVCPLARVLRGELRKRGILEHRVLYSREEPIAVAAQEPAEAKKSPERRSVPGSLSFVPPVAGMILAGEVIKALTLSPKLGQAGTL